MKKTTVMLTIGSLLVTAWSSSAWANTFVETRVGSRFQLYAPPNNDQTYRYSTVVVTAMGGDSESPCVVDLIDDATDGDDDDTMMGVELVRGQSLVRYIKDGAVNDDYGVGAAWDGDMFVVDATCAVSAHIATDSFWQHDWVPAANGTLRGELFFIHATYGPRDINAFAYEDDTRLTLYEITDQALNGGGTTMLAESLGEPILSLDLDAGEDLYVAHDSGVGVIERNRSYMVVASKPVTMMSGSVTGPKACDGGSYVPGVTGRTSDTEFVFTIPHDESQPFIQELRLMSSGASNAVELLGYNEVFGQWETAATWLLDDGESADFAGIGSHRLWKLTSSEPVTVFEGARIESGAEGTSDGAGFVTGTFGTEGSGTFHAYVAPPGFQNNTSTGGVYSHVYLFGRGATTARIRDASTNGTIIDTTVGVPANGMTRFSIDEDLYDEIADVSAGTRPYLTIDVGTPISVMTSNWNSDWMAYASSVLVRDPQVAISGPASATIGGGSVTLEMGVEALADPNLDTFDLTLLIPPQLEYVGASATGASVRAPSNVTATANGLTRISFDSLSISDLQSSGSASPIALEVVATSGMGGRLVTIEASASATSFGASSVSTSVHSLELTASSGPALSRMDVDVIGRSVKLAVAASGDAGEVQFWRALDPQGPFTFIGAMNFSGGSRGVYYEDNDAPRNTRLYYRAVNAVGTSIAGPATGEVVDLEPPDAPTLDISELDGDIVVTMSGSETDDLAGYHLERATRGLGNWTQLTAAPIAGGAFTDDSVVASEAYIYRAWAVDTSGNASEFSDPQIIVLPLPGARVESTVLAWEDMIGSGENDWDYNDFVLRVTSYESYVENVGIESVTIDYEPLARGASYIHELHQRLEIQGDWSATLRQYDPVDPTSEATITTFEGTGPLDLPIYMDTRYALSPQVEAYTNTSLSQRNFYIGAGARLTVSIKTPELNQTLGDPNDSPWDVYIRLPYLPEPNVIKRPAFGGPVEMTDSHASLVGSPLDFVIELDSNARWPLEGRPIWLAFEHYVDHVLAASEPSWSEEPTDATKVFNAE